MRIPSAHIIERASADMRTYVANAPTQTAFNPL